MSHILFADDTMIICQTNGVVSRVVMGLLRVYSLVSGHQINLEKSHVVFSRSVGEDLRESVRGILGVQVVDKHEKNHVLPTTMGLIKWRSLGG